MERMVGALRAVAEPTRVRLVALCAQCELAVTELASILGQSQPRVSRHLKLLCEAGLLERTREGHWVFYRTAARGEGGRLASALLDLLPRTDPTFRLDGERLDAIVAARREAAAQYFRENAAQWDEIRTLYIDEADVERALVSLLPSGRLLGVLDIGTGTARMLELLADQADQAVGIDLSREMLAVARANLGRANARNCMVRHADMYQLPWAGASFEVVVIHQVLHFADQPAAVIAEAGRVLRPGGVLIVADFAPHELEYLRAAHAHRRLGFSDEQIDGWCREAGLRPRRVLRLPGQPLTVVLWSAERAQLSPATGICLPETAEVGP